MNEAPIILYVEDNRDNRRLVGRILKMNGYTLHEAEDAQSAYAFLESTIPDLILMDINLPEIDGYTLTDQLRKRPELMTIPIIALTANVMKQDREKSLAAGCNGLIKKPIDIDLLPEQIEFYLQQTESE